MSGPSAPRQVLDDIGLSLVFFTRLRLPSSDFGGRNLADAIWAAPFAGLAVAIIGALVYAIAYSLGLASGPAAALTLAATMLVTGCLHEDGLSDIADGFGGGRTRDRKLEIMRDSRIGAYGAAAVGASLLIRWSALSELAGPGHIFLALLGAHAASRGLFGAFMHLLPPARAD
ncbi:MAG: adenosylcobinamide-GDP ribazoletransferase, partial [Mesorhizobium sp.]|nr:adenosylcobinamide-GDP ribazoletransferase [Mesorhizobium sp.]